MGKKGIITATIDDSIFELQKIANSHEAETVGTCDCCCEDGVPRPWNSQQMWDQMGMPVPKDDRTERLCNRCAKSLIINHS